MRRIFNQKTLLCLLTAGAIAGVMLACEDNAVRASEPTLQTFIPGGSVTVGYGVKREGKRDSTGVNVAAVVGTPIATPVDATVVEVSNEFRNEPRYGKAVVLKLADGTNVWITHLDSYSVKPGDRLVAGDVFATVGKTRFMKVPHVHIEAYLASGVDRRVDPATVWPFLSKT